ncbi:MAG: hypothetical protein IPN01_24000 [Deltaproteobacteria bacterium]|nr:hypothetical protein [Deltaproteobacteria bacterium]
MSLTMLALNPRSGELEPRAVSPGVLRLARVDGAERVHIVITEEGSETHHRFEVLCPRDAQLRLELRAPAPGQVELISPGREVFRLPADAHHGPKEGGWRGGAVLPRSAAREARSLDLALLIDGTMTWFEDEEHFRLLPLLAEPERWAGLVDGLVAFAVELSKAFQGRLRVATLAFGDTPLPHAHAEDLVPRYEVWPEGAARRGFRALHAGGLSAQLRQIPHSSGGDFVDALAEGLHACSRLTWESERRMLLVVGDSPGCSVLRPVGHNADAQVRSRDVESELVRLHEHSVEVISLYNPPPHDSGFYDKREKAPAQLLAAAREQYARLATHSSLALDVPSFNPGEAAAVAVARQGPFARASTWGMWVESIS